MTNNNKETENIEQSELGDVLYEFTTPEFETQERSTTWFIVLGICVIAGVVFGIFTESLSVVLLSVMIGFIYTVTHNNKPNEISIVFTNMGMQWKNIFFSYQEIDKFWIFYIPHQQKTLHIILKKGRSPHEIIIPIKSQKVSNIRETLGYYVPEDQEMKEGFEKILTRKFKL